MVKKILISLIFTIFTLVLASPLDYINSLRTKSGIMPLKYSSILSASSKHHAKYLSANNEYSHYENSASAYYYANSPWNRIVKAGYKTKVVIENISFFEPNYNASIDKIMGTVYHRLAFLYPEIDSIGYATVGKVYVYNMSNSKIADICSKNYKDAKMVIDGICPNGNIIVPQNLFNKAINSMLKKSKKVMVYPYNNQKNVSLLGVEETPKFLYEEFGYPVTATFNKFYYKNPKVLSFKLYKNGNEVESKIVSKYNDINSKIKKETFVLVPLYKLKSKSTYNVVLKFKVGLKTKSKRWSFTTK